MTPDDKRLQEIEERLEKWQLTHADFRWLIAKVRELETKLDVLDEENMGLYREMDK